MRERGGKIGMRGRGWGRDELRSGVKERRGGRAGWFNYVLLY